MANWQHKITGVRKLLGAFEDGDSSAANIKAIHAILTRKECFRDFIWLDDMEDFKDSGDVEEDREEANGLLAAMYDYADSNLIWIE